MMGCKNKVVFGPVPSRRLGKSVGINNIPPKHCTYSCIYCQIGKTINNQIKPRIFYKPQYIFDELKNKIYNSKINKEKIDFLTFVPDGEPTLDTNIGKEIEMIQKFKYKIAVITNGSLIWKRYIQDKLSDVDTVSIKIDTVNLKIWKKINRPNPSLKLDKILAGIKDFSKNFKGNLITETMIIKGLNDNFNEFEKISDFIKDLDSNKSYLSVPIRPPTEKFVEIPNEHCLNTAYNIFRDKGIETEFLTGYEGNAFAYTGNVKDDILSITSVHPMREDAVSEYLLKAGADWTIINKLIDNGDLIESYYKNIKFYLRKLS